MKEYQVVTVGEKMTWRNGEIYCHNPEEMDLAEVIQTMLNRYGQEGWIAKGLFYVNNYSYLSDHKVLIVFERGLLNRDGKRVKRKRKLVKTQYNLKR